MTSIIEKNLSDDLIIVFDDWHNAAKYLKLQEFIKVSCKKEISKLHIILISRKSADDYYIELESKRKCIIIDEKDIKFTMEETKNFFYDNGFKIGERQLSKIYNYTGGWTAATYLNYMQKKGLSNQKIIINQL